MIIAEAKAARFAGRMSDGLAEAQRARNIAEEHDEVDESAHAAFEIAFDHMWCGRFPEAEAAIRGSAGGLDTLASVRWIAWADWQTGCLELYANQPNAALTSLERAQALFAADGLAAGEVACITVSMTAHRMLGDDRDFHACRHELEQRRGERGWTDYTDLSISQELAEWARTHGQTREAEQLLIQLRNRSTERPLHLCLAHLGLAELHRSQGKDNVGDVAAARELAAQLGFAFLTAHAEVADHLAGRTTADATIATISRLRIQLATRTGKPAAGPLDFCLGQHPEQHELFLP